MTSRNRLHVCTEPLEARLLLAAAPDLSGIEFRTIDGTNNNLTKLTQGAAETRQIRFGYGDDFPDGYGDLIVSWPDRANPRTISNVLHAQEDSVTSRARLTDWIFVWGQFLTHDIDLTLTGAQYDYMSTGETGYYGIPITDPSDPLGPNPIPFHRSRYDEGTGVPGARREVVNSVTSYIDASMIYGSDPARAAALRTFQGGKLKTSAGGKLLPLNTGGLQNDDPLGLGSALFLAGDIRVNEAANLTVTHTLFLREHNRLAGRIAKLYPGLSDEQIYQMARRIVGAEIQKITYEEYLPAVFGHDLSPSAYSGAYNPAVNASITNSFAHAAFRFGHSQINEAVLLVRNSGQVAGSLSIDESFFNPNFLKNNPGNLDLMLKGLASQVGQEVDLELVDGIRNNLFGPPGAGGLDLAALDIQRGRDHGLPDYNNLRARYGVGRVTSFDQISSDPAIQAKLEQLFGNVDNIDAFVGALAEDHLPGASVGPLVHAIVGNQFDRLRDGDRFFYTNDSFLQSDAVRRVLKLDKVSLSKIIRWNSGVSNIQKNVFYDRSVLIYEAPESGGEVVLRTVGNDVVLIDRQDRDVLVRRPLSEVSRVILVGSDTGNDIFNIAVANANGRLEDGVSVYGLDPDDDVLNVLGTRQHDTFVVTDTSFSTGTVDVLDDRITQSVDGRTIDINGTTIASSGFETIRLVTLGGDDSIENEETATLELLTSPVDPLA